MNFLSVQSLDVISVNVWSILISLINLVIIFFIVKKFFYGPVHKMMDARREEIASRYQAADEAKAAAEADRDLWAKKNEGAEAEADRILKNAEASAELRGKAIVAEADRKAEAILRRAENEADLERRKASEEIRREVVDLSSALAEKMLEREIRQEDHRALIDAFIGDGEDGHGGTE